MEKNPSISMMKIVISELNRTLLETTAYLLDWN